MKKRNYVVIFVILFLLFSVGYPLLQMIGKINISDFKTLYEAESFKEAFSNSIFVTAISTILSITIAWFLAYTLNRTNVKHKAFLRVILVVPMLIPSISHGLGLINLFGKNGIISSICHFNIIGKSGIIIGSILYSFPIAFLMIDDGYRYIDNNMYNAAKVLGLNKFQTFSTVTFTYLKKPILSAIFAVFTMIFTDYGVPLSVGGTYITLPVYLYKEVIGLLNFSKGTIIGLILLIPAFVSFIFDTFSKDYGTGNVENTYNIEENKKRDIICNIFLYIVILSMLLLFGSFIVYAFVNNIVLDKSISFNHFDYVISDGLITYMGNSLIISILVSLLGTFISFVIAYVTARVGGKISRIAHIMTISSLAIPGIVLGLSYIMGFKGTIIYNTIFILVLVNIIHFLASPYLMAYNALKKVNPNYEVVAKTCNISTIKIIIDVIIPCIKNTLREMLGYYFVNSMITISAVTFLYNIDTMPASLLINKYEGNLLLGEAAVVSLVLLFFNIIVKGFIYLLNRRDFNGGVLNENFD